MEFFDRYRWQSILASAAALAGTVLVFPGRFNESVRFKFYGATWKYFVDKVDVWRGSGLNTFIGLGPVIQRDSGIMMDRACGGEVCWWLSLHSDWFQLLVETGVIGFCLGLCLYVNALVRSDKQTRIALTLLAICGLGYFPVQIPAIEVYAAWLVARSQFKEVV